MRRRRVMVAALLALVGGAILVSRGSATPVVSTTTVGLGPGATAVDARSGRVFVANAEDRTVSLLDSRSGRLVRTITVGLYPELVAVDATAGHAFVGTDEGQVSMLDGQTGAVLHSVRVGTAVADLAVDEQTGRVFGAEPDDGTVCLLDARSGALLARIPVSGDPQLVAVDARTGRVFVASEGATGGYITVLDARSGAVVATLPVGPGPRPWVQEDSGQVVVSDRRGDVVLLDARSGRRLRTATLGWELYAGVVDEPAGRVILAAAPLGTAPSTLCSGAGRLVVLEGRSATLRRSVAVAARPCLLALNPLTGHLWAVALGTAGHGGAGPEVGRLSVFDARTLAPRDTIALGLSPSGLAIDARAGHAFVTDAHVNADGSVTGVAAPEGVGVRLQRWLRHTLSWLPLPEPPPPPLTLQGTVTVLDATQL